MRVICKDNTAIVLPPKYFLAFPGDSDASIYHVTVGTEYPVFGMALRQQVIILLLMDDTNKPNWYPVDFFSVTEPKLPADWFFSKEVANEHGIDALWGYELLASDPKHYGALIERDPGALRLFEDERRRRLGFRRTG
jgi:hypothetical protein